MNIDQVDVYYVSVHDPAFLNTHEMNPSLIYTVLLRLLANWDLTTIYGTIGLTLWSEALLFLLGMDKFFCPSFLDRFIVQISIVRIW